MKILKLMLIFLLAIIMFPTIEAQGHHNYDYGYNDYGNHYSKKYKQRDRYNKNYRYDRITIESLELRIARADRHGELSGKERRKLDRELYELKKLERKVYRNHRVTEGERRKLELKKIELDRLIDRYANNRKRW